MLSELLIYKRQTGETAYTLKLLVQKHFNGLNENVLLKTNTIFI